MMEPVSDAFDQFSAPAREWLRSVFTAPTEAQRLAWPVIGAGHSALVVAPTGSGKTLAAFLWAIDKLTTEARATARPRILYISPLKALAADIERNLRAPLAGLKSAAARLEAPFHDVSVAVRTGDTSPAERRRQASGAGDVLITTPESLFLLLTSRARESLTEIETVIVDEVHALVPTKRGSHLAVSLERLDALLPRPAQRVGLSATVRPVDEVAAWLNGTRPIETIEVAAEKRLDLTVVVPVPDMGRMGEELEEVTDGPVMGPEARASIWPHVESELLGIVRAHRSTIIFVNSRRLAERLCTRLNELADEQLARAHHGSVSREERIAIEDALKEGRLRAVVATSSLELGIDMAAVDLVVQVGSPESVASGLQRVGRAGHQVGAVSRGFFFPKHRGDLLECAVVTERMQAREIEHLTYPRNPLDVLAQHVVSMVAMDEWHVEDLDRLVRGAAPFGSLPSGGLESVLDMLSGKYPSIEFAELRPRLNWDRSTGVLTGRPGAQRLAVTSGGVIPDRGLFGVFMAGEKNRRVGELDEEMVYESRVGDTFVLGSTTWMIDEITHDRVVVTPAPGLPGKMPFWHGDSPGRPVELGRALGEFVREVVAADESSARTRLAAAGLDERAATNLLVYLEEQREATGAVPNDRTIVVERFRDELGDWRICLHSPFGARVHAPWSQAIQARLRALTDVEVQTMHSDDGIVVRVPDSDQEIETAALFFDADEIEEIVVGEVGSSALFASRFRECAARSLLLPRRNPGSRTPLWLQRQKGSALLQIARKYESFPVVLEAYREALSDVFDLRGLAELMQAIERRVVNVVDVQTDLPSPFAKSLQFAYIGAFMYEGDAPLAERRAQALALDRSLLAELLGRSELRELIDVAALAGLELELQGLTARRRLRDADALHDTLRRLGDLTHAELVERMDGDADVDSLLAELMDPHRALRVLVAGSERWIAVEDAAVYRDALGVPLPPGVPHVFLEPVPDALEQIVARFARTHGPFTVHDVAARFGLGAAVVLGVVGRLVAAGRLIAGEFRPGGAGTEWVDPEVLRDLRRRSLAALRKEVAPVDAADLVRFSLAWHNTGAFARRRATPDALYEVIVRLQGAPIPASALETLVLPARLADYSPALLDELCAAGDVVWVGTGGIGAADGWVSLATADKAALLLPEADTNVPSPTAQSVLGALEERGAMFFRQIADATRVKDDADLLGALWELVWAGRVTNDTLKPLRAVLSGGGATRRARAPGRPTRGPRLPARSGPPTGAGRWSIAPAREENVTKRLHAFAHQLLERHGIVAPGTTRAERNTSFAPLYRVLKAMEEAGTCRRGYFVEGLGGAQFALAPAIDRMRAGGRDVATGTHLLATTDPASPFGGVLDWPVSPDGGHRPGRKAGAVVVISDGSPVIYVERGGKTILSFTGEADALQRAADALALAIRDRSVNRLDVETADGVPVGETPLGEALRRAGFRESSRGLRLRA